MIGQLRRKSQMGQEETKHIRAPQGCAPNVSLDRVACNGRGVLMKLFYAPGSSSLLPHIVLYEAGLPFEVIKINEHTKAMSGGGDYRSVNPLGYVPALVLDDGTLLTEGS